MKEVWVVINGKSRDLLGVYSNRDKAIEASSRFMDSNKVLMTEMKAMILDKDVSHV